MLLGVTHQSCAIAAAPAKHRTAATTDCTQPPDHAISAIHWALSELGSVAQPAGLHASDTVHKAKQSSIADVLGETNTLHIKLMLIIGLTSEPQYSTHKVWLQKNPDKPSRFPPYCQDQSIHCATKKNPAASRFA
jgi:hypothetical protein